MLDGLTTALVADACVRLSIPLRLAPPGLRPLLPGRCLAGRVLPARHAGSVDVFLEAFEAARPGDVIVIDNGGRLDEACIGDLTILEAKSAGAAGVLVWGAHRDSAELHAVGLPVFSYGTCAAGPLRAGPRPDDALLTARVGTACVGSDDAVILDDDGAVFVALARIDEIAARAREIAHAERRQADLARAGTSLREQFRFSEFLKRRSETPSLTFRQHLRGIEGAIEE
jgi:regulator of RNase E activity RraA